MLFILLVKIYIYFNINFNFNKKLYLKLKIYNEILKNIFFILFILKKMKSNKNIK